MTSTRYDSYLQSDDWHSLRTWVKARDGYVCQDCGTPQALHVHHLNYERFGHESHTDLITVCDWCHEARHKWWWTRVPGGAASGRDFTFDYLGPQTEWRLRAWGPVERLVLVFADEATTGLTYREQAWYAELSQQHAYGQALERVSAQPEHSRIVRTASRFPSYVPAPRRPPERSRKRKRILWWTFALIVVIAWLLALLAGQSAHT